MLRIRRTTPLAAATLLAALTAGNAFAGESSRAERSPLASPGDGLGMLLRPAVVESIAAWGLSPEEVVCDVQRLDAAELARMVGEATRLAGPDWRRSARSQAMYLVLVAQVRESLLFARVLSGMRSAGVAAPRAREPAR